MDLDRGALRDLAPPEIPVLTFGFKGRQPARVRGGAFLEDRGAVPLLYFNRLEGRAARKPALVPRKLKEIEMAIRETPFQGTPGWLTDLPPDRVGSLEKSRSAMRRYVFVFLGLVELALALALLLLALSLPARTEVAEGFDAAVQTTRAARTQVSFVRTPIARVIELIRKLDPTSITERLGIPLGGSQLQRSADELDKSFADMASGLERVERVLPVYSDASLHCLLIGRLLAFLVAATAGVHGSLLVASEKLERRPRAATGSA
jgi:hypothetical protein